MLAFSLLSRDKIRQLSNLFTIIRAAALNYPLSIVNYPLSIASTLAEGPSVSAEAYSASSDAWAERTAHWAALIALRAVRFAVWGFPTGLIPLFFFVFSRNTPNTYLFPYKVLIIKS